MNYTYEKVDVGDVKMFVRGQHFAKIGDAYWGFNEGYFTAPGCGPISANYATNHGLDIFIRVPVPPKKYRLEVYRDFSISISNAKSAVGWPRCPQEDFLESVGLEPGTYTVTEGHDAE